MGQERSEEEERKEREKSTEDVLGELGGLSRAGFSHDEQEIVMAEGVKEGVLEGEDGEILWLHEAKGKRKERKKGRKKKKNDDSQKSSA